jgi:lichenan operon transcriptional antiterminator
MEEGNDMKDKYAKLLLQLQKSRGGIGGQALAKDLNVSTRTIRNYIKDLNENYLTEGTITSDSTKGYILNGSITNLTETDQLIFEQRAFFIIKYLMSESDVSYEKLANRLHYSVPTIRSDIYRIQKIIESEGRNVNLEAIIFQGVSLLGDELDCRLLLDSFFNPQLLSIEQFLIDFNFYFEGWTKPESIKKLYSYICRELERQNIKCDVRLLRSVLTYLVISVYRNKHSHFLDNAITSTMNINKSLYILAEALFHQTVSFISENTLVVTKEIENFYWFLISQEFSSTVGQQFYSIDPEILDWVKESLTQTNKIHQVDFINDQKLLTDLALHISRDILPLKFNFFIENSYLHHIKTDYVIAYQYAVTFTECLKREAGITLPENEIGYLALHFAAYIERHKQRDINVAIIYGAHAVSAKLLAHRIEEIFSNLNVKQIAHVSNIKKVQDIDFIIASDRIVVETEIPFVLVNDLLTKNDVKKINLEINWLVLSNVLKNSVLIHGHFTDKKDIIKQLLVRLKQPEMFDNVMEREQLSSTDVGTFTALPHPLIMKVGCPFSMGIAVLDKPVQWGEREVSLVILPLPDSNNHLEYERVFGILQRIIVNEDNLAQLKQLRVPDDFMKLIL